MKQCTKCQEWKPEVEFGKAKKGKDGLSTVCKDCRHSYYLAHAEKIKAKSSRYYYRNREKALECAKNSRTKNKIKRAAFMDDVKTECVKCGEERRYLVEFHHIDPSDKKYNISEYKVVNETLFNEIKKCICLCRNCHFEFHYIYGTKPSRPIETLTEYLGTNPYSLVPNINEEVYQYDETSVN